jgi:VWFA-related protein
MRWNGYITVIVSLRARTQLVILVGAFCCAQSGGQAPPPSVPEVSSHEAPVTFSSRVNLISVPVVVRDKEGRAVGTLQKEDFQVFDKGKLQAITKFSIEKSGSSAVGTAPSATPREPAQAAAPVITNPVLPERFVAYLFDDVHLQGNDLLQARQAVNHHLDESLEPAARAAIFTTSGRMLTEFTDDREKLHKAVNSILPWTSGPDPQQDCPPMTYYMADLLVNKLMYLDGILFTDDQLSVMIGKGQVDKALLAEMAEAAACGAAPAGVGGSKNELTGQQDPTIDLLREVRKAARLTLTYGDRETNLALGSVEDVVRRISAMPRSRTIVLVSPGFLLTRDHQSHEYDALDRAIRANVTINTIDIRGLYTTPDADASHKGYNSVLGGYLSQADVSAANEAQNVLGELADGTGGRFFHNDNGLKEGLNLLAARPEYVYVLGFSPQELKYDGAYHGLKVTVKNSAHLTIQARRGYWAPRHAVDSAEAAREEIQETVFSREEIQGVPLDVQTEFFDSGDQKFELTVTAQLDVKALQFSKAQDRNDDTLTVVAGLFDPNGNYVAGVEKVVELHLRDQTLATFQNAGINVKEIFKVAPGRYLVRVVVRDSGGKTMTARNGGVQIP